MSSNIHSSLNSSINLRCNAIQIPLAAVKVLTTATVIVVVAAAAAAVTYVATALNGRKTAASAKSTAASSSSNSSNAELRTIIICGISPPENGEVFKIY